MKVRKATELNELPVGYFVYPKGEVVREYELDELKGVDREEIGDIMNNRRDPSAISNATNNILTRRVKLAGSRLTENQAKELTVADRQFLTLQLRRKSLGANVKPVKPCSNPDCDTELQFRVDLDDIDVYVLEEQDYEIEEIEEDKAYRAFKIEVTDEDDLIFEFPKGRHQTEVNKKREENMVKAQHLMYRECLIRRGEKTAESLPNEYFSQQSLKLLTALDEQFPQKMPGPDIQLQSDCVNCGTTNRYSLQVQDFLYQRPRQGGLQRGSNTVPSGQ